MAPDAAFLASARLTRRLASLLYETILVAAILLAAAVIFYVASPGLIAGVLRHLLQFYLAAVLAAYFLWCWCRGGQTLPMKTWKLRLIDGRDRPPSTTRALVRLFFAALTIGTGVAGIAVAWKRPLEPLGWTLIGVGLSTIGWALFDRDGQFLHDRLAGTRIVESDSAIKSKKI